MDSAHSHWYGTLHKTAMTINTTVVQNVENRNYDIFIRDDGVIHICFPFFLKKKSGHGYPRPLGIQYYDRDHRLIIPFLYE